MQNLKQLRDKIDKIDAAIIKKLAMRRKLSNQIGLIKAQAGKQVIDTAREKKLMQFYDDLCAQYQLQPVFIKRLFKIIIKESRRLQK